MGRIAARAALIAGLTLPFVLIGERELASDAAPLSEAPPPQPDRSLNPRLTEAFASMRYGLSHADIDNYRRLFAATDRQDWDQVKAISGLIGDRRLAGHVLAARYLAPNSRPSLADLHAWLDIYGDHPEADDVQRLAAAQEPPGGSSPARPRRTSDETDFDMPDSEAPGPAEPHTIAGARALARFYASDYKGALADAARAIESLGERASTSRWIAGLAAWRMGLLRDAEHHFTALASSKCASGWMVAAGAYWAGRVEERNGALAASARWFGSASRFPTTFYGLLARRKLGFDAGPRPSAESITAKHLDILAENPAGYRAIALLEIGRRTLAADELERIDAAGDPRMEEAMIVVADAANLGEISPVLAERISQPADELIRRRYPIPDWRPHGGFKIDPALVYAVARQESRFDVTAHSPSGATGLMQIMPHTAVAVAPREQRSLFDPSTNLDVGQRYIRALMRDPNIGDNLLLLAVAYSGGSGNPAKFHKMMIHDDPLLAVESIPSAATREYIKHVITYYWIYSARLGDEITSLSDLAEGRWPHYRWDDSGQ